MLTSHLWSVAVRISHCALLLSVVLSNNLVLPISSNFFAMDPAAMRLSDSEFEFNLLKSTLSSSVQIKMCTWRLLRPCSSTAYVQAVHRPNRPALPVSTLFLQSHPTTSSITISSISSKMKAARPGYFSRNCVRSFARARRSSSERSLMAVSSSISHPEKACKRKLLSSSNVTVRNACGAPRLWHIDSIFIWALPAASLLCGKFPATVFTYWRYFLLTAVPPKTRFCCADAAFAKSCALSPSTIFAASFPFSTTEHALFSIYPLNERL